MSWLFKREKKASDLSIEREVEQAKWESYRKGKISRAKRQGFSEGFKKPTSMSERVLGGFQAAEAGFNVGSQFGGSLLGDFGFGPQPRKKAHHRKRKGKTITIHVK